MKYSINITLIVIITLIFGCSNSVSPDYNGYYNSLSNLDAKAAIAKANEWHYTASKISAHVTPKEVIIEFPDKRTVTKQLPADLMYIAIAPYINTTHQCETHYPSSCSGELTEKTVYLTAKDENGNVLYDNNITTLKNGFFELWLPRNINVKLEITYDGKTGQETIPTREDSRTCITTIKLK